MGVSNREYKDYAILLQGPIFNLEFLVVTCEMYAEYYPGCTILISTWKDEAHLLELVQRTGNIARVSVLGNEKPEHTGWLNFNYQCVSTLNGLRRIALDKGITYVIKTRTDQRFCMAEMLDYFTNLLAAFPRRGGSSTDLLSSRIIAMSYINGSVNFAFDICDFRAFSRIENLLVLYELKLDDVDKTRDEFNKKKKEYQEISNYLVKMTYRTNDISIGEKEQYRDYIRNCPIPERNFYVQLARKLGYSLRGNYLGTFWTLLKNDMIIVDHEALEFVWNKYEYSAAYIFTSVDRSFRLDMAKWLDILMNYEERGVTGGNDERITGQ